ncbi:MAG: tetratricopeptide repeat protein [Longimicrobiales bacterium]|nr:tetratricopeptide repeat protein [Longimicrobiales bacterium]
MTWLNKLFGSSRDEGRVDYYEEGLALLKAGKFHEALTSFRLALKESPGDHVVLQQIAISYTRIGMTEEAAKTYRHVLKNRPDAAGAHYGLAFLYLRAGQHEDALRHLRAFLANTPDTEVAADHVNHARTTMAQLTGEVEVPEPDTGGFTEGGSPGFGGTGGR